MNSRYGINDNNKKDRTKLASTIPMLSAIVTAALLLSGLSLIGSYPSATAQQNMTEGGAGTTGGNATTAGGNATTAGGNATTAGVGNQTVSSEEVVVHLEEVRTALENDDTETALMHLDLALNELGANTTTTAGGEEGEEGEGEEEED